MTAISWKSAVSGNWTTAADWSTGTVPGSGDDATIGVTGAYTVSLTTAITVHSITISDPNAVFAIAAPGTTEAVTTTLTNGGTTTIDAGGAGGTTVTLGGALTNSGNLAIGNGAISSATTLRAASLNNAGTIALTGGTAAATLKLTGVTDNAGNLVLTGIAVLTGAAFTNNGTFALDNDRGDAGGGSAVVGVVSNNGDIDIGNSGLGTAATMTATGFSNTPSGTVALEGGAAQATLHVTAAAPTTLIGFVYLYGPALLEYASGGITSIAANSQLSLDGVQARVALAGSLGSNSALGGLATNNGEFDLADGAAVSTTTGFTNNYYTYVDSGYGPGGMAGGSSLTVRGTLTNNDYIDIGNIGIRAATTLTAAALVNDGEIDLTGEAARATLDILGAAPTTVTDAYYLEGDALLEFASGSFTTIASSAELALDGPRTHVALSSNPSANGALSKLAGNAGTLDLADVAVSTTVAFTNNGYTSIDDDSSDTYDKGGSRVTIGGTLTNNDYLDIGNTGLLAGTTVTATALINTAGSIDLTGGATAAATATLDVTAQAAPSTLSGSFSLSGSAVLDYASGSIGAIGSSGDLSINGARSFVSVGTATTSNSALTKLATNSGTLDLEDTSLATTTGLSNSGSLSVDEYGTGGSSFTIGGTLTNNDYLDIGNTDITAATTVEAAALTGTGSLSVTGGAAQASLIISGAAGFGTAGVVSTDVTLSGDALLQFGSGGLTSIASDANLTLDGGGAQVHIAGDTANNNALTTLASNAGTLDLENGASLATTVGLNNSQSLYVDEDATGGSSLAIGGTLTNSSSGYLYIGSSSLSANTTVTAKALSNTSVIGLTGVAGHIAKLAVAGSATSSGDLGLEDAVLTTTAGLTNSGSFEVDDEEYDASGSSVTIGGTLSNSGYGYIEIGNTDLSANTIVTAAAMDNTTNSEINLAGGAGHLAELVVNGNATNTGTIYVGAATELDVTGAHSFTQTAGTTTVGGLLVAPTVNADGGVVDFTAALTSGDGTGALDIGAGGTLEFGAAVDSSHTVKFAASTSRTLELGAPASFAGTIAGFSGSDVIDLIDTAVTKLSYSGTATSGTLTVTGASGTLATLAFTGDYTTASFSTESDENGGTDILDPPTASPKNAGDAIDVAEIGFGAPATLGYRATGTGGTLGVAAGRDSASLALLGHYIASSFALAGDGHEGTLISEPALAAQHHLALPIG